MRHDAALRGGARLAVVATIALVCAVHEIRPTGKVGDITYTLATLAVPLFGFVLARRASVPDRRAIHWLLAGIVCSGVGDLVYFVMAWSDRLPPGASVADAFYLVSYVVIGIGVLLLVQRVQRLRDLETIALVDLGSFAVMTIIVIAFATDVTDVFNDQSLPLVTRLVLCAYPILDAGLLAVVARALMARTMLNRRGLVMLAGVTCWLVTDFANLLLADTSAYTSVLDLGWMLGSALMAMCPLLSATAVVSRPPTPWSERRVATWVGFSLFPLLAPAIVEVWGQAAGRQPGHIGLLVAALVLVLLAIVRSVHLVRARSEQERRLRESEHYFQALAENSADAVVVIDPAGRIANDAPSLAKMLGCPGATTRGADAIDLLNPLEAERGRSALGRVLQAAPGHIVQSEFVVLLADGEERWFSFRAVNRMDDPVIGGVIVNLQDVTDRKRVEAEMVHRAMHDSLTGLANRTWFQDRVDAALRRRMPGRTQVAVVYLDVDGFKALNDVRGHEIGDMALQEIADRLMKCVRPADVVARLGGDEFAVLIESPRALDAAIATAARVLESLREPIRLDDRHVPLSASIGIVTSDDGATASSMLRDADIAMYESKSAGRGTWSVYEPHMRTSAVDRMQLDIDLRTALAGNQFHLVYQPIIDLATEAIVGFEALLRWQHPTRGLIRPDHFVPVAEANGTIVEIGRWLLDEACRVAADWRQRTGGSRPSMSVNVSTRQLSRAEFVDNVRDALQRHGLPPGTLVLEMTESVLVQDPLIAAHRLNELHDLGVRLAVDDFGTGYSSLSYLRQFPVDILKIDRSFVQSITDRDRLPNIVRGLLELGRTLGLQVVAEGIETEMQRDTLREQSCQFGQGYLFAKPLPEPAALQLLMPSLSSTSA